MAIARAFVHGPRVLFADEPTGNLDQRTGRHVCDLLFALNRDHHTTLVLVTHDAHLAARCDRAESSWWKAASCSSGHGRARA